MIKHLIFQSLAKFLPLTWVAMRVEDGFQQVKELAPSNSDFTIDHLLVIDPVFRGESIHL